MDIASLNEIIQMVKTEHFPHSFVIKCENFNVIFMKDCLFQISGLIKDVLVLLSYPAMKSPNT